MAGVCRLFMGLPVPPSTPKLPHQFVYIPWVAIPEAQLPPLAGTRGVAALAAAPAAAVATPTPTPMAAALPARGAAAVGAAPASAAAAPSGGRNGVGQPHQPRRDDTEREGERRDSGLAAAGVANRTGKVGGKLQEALPGGGMGGVAAPLTPAPAGPQKAFPAVASQQVELTST